MDNVKITNGGALQRMIYQDGFPSASVQAEGPTTGIVYQTMNRSTSYYTVNGQRAEQEVPVALRKAGFMGDNGLKWMPGGHLGSTSVVVNASGANPATQGYLPWGETRYGSVPTSYQYTGQLNETAIGLYYYGARWYDPALGRFVQPDSIIPEASQGVQAWDRYAYGSNNPSRFIDPSGHVDIETGKGPYDGLSWTDKILLHPKEWVVNWGASRFHISFTDFSFEQMWQAYVAALLTGDALATASKAVDTAWSAFNTVYGTVKLTMGNCDNCPSPTGGRTYPYNGSYWDIRFNGLMEGMAGVHNIIHEFGHVFDGTFWNLAEGNSGQPSMIAWNNKGLPQSSSGFVERFGLDDTASELFADMFLGWVTGQFSSNSAGVARSDWMTTNMVEFLN